MIKQKLDNTYIPMETGFPIVDTALMKAYSEMIAALGYFVNLDVKVNKAEKVSELGWHVTSSNTYKFMFPCQETPFLSGSFESIVSVKCNVYGEIDYVEGHELVTDGTIKVLNQNDDFTKLVKNIGKPEGDVFFDLITTLKFAEHGVPLEVKDGDGSIRKFEWGDYFNEHPVQVSDLIESP